MTLPETELVRVLDQDGRFTPSPAAEQYLSLIEAISDAELEQFYRDMVVIRAIDTQATNLQRQGQLALWPPSRGQEAAQVGSARAARAQDTLFPSYREHAVTRIRGVDPVDIIKLMRGVSHGGWDPTDPKNGNTRLYTLVLGSQVLHAAGFAMGLNFDGRSGTGDLDTDEAVIVYYGDGASSQGDVHEAMVFAASYQAPTVFFLQNNHWAISVPVSTQSRVPLVERSAGYGIPSVRVDGNDVLASYAVSRVALDEARSGGGPRAIEAVPTVSARTPPATTPRSTAAPTKSSHGRSATRSIACARSWRTGERPGSSSPMWMPRRQTPPKTCVRAASNSGRPPQT